MFGEKKIFDSKGTLLEGGNGSPMGNDQVVLDEGKLKASVQEVSPVDVFEKPQVYDYLDALKYLQDLMAWRKYIQNDFSYALWARELGFQSRTFLRFILTGKRKITSNSVLLFKKGLKLNKSESQYFEILVNFSQASTSLEKEEYTKDIAKILRTLSRPKTYDTFHFLSSYLAPRILVLLGAEGLQQTTVSLSKSLKSPESVIDEILNTMASMGLVKGEVLPSKKIIWKKLSYESLNLVDKIANPAIQSYHKKSLAEAIELIDLPVCERNFQSLAIPLTSNDYQELCESVVGFLETKMNKYDFKRLGQYRVYQLNLNLVPVSEPILHDPNCESEGAAINKKQGVKNEK